MSMNVADLYGRASVSSARPAEVTTGGPNQGAVSPPGNQSVGQPEGAHIAWVAMLLLLIALRVIIQMSGRRQGNLV